MHREESRHDFAFIAGVIVGAISGALVTLALTPMSGTETRERVMERGGDLEPMKEKAAGLASSGKHFVETGREKATEIVAKSPLPFGEHAATDTEAETASSASAVTSSFTTASVSGGITHTPATGATATTEGNGVTSTETRTDGPARPA